MNLNTITNFKVTELNANTLKAQKITLIKSDGAEINIDYIISTRSCKELTDIDEKKREEVLKLINLIYKDNNKLKILGLGYPIFQVGTTLSKELACTLIGFKPSTNKDSYTCPSYVTHIGIDDNKYLEIYELEFINKIKVISFGSTYKLKIKGIENISELNDKNIRLIDKVVREQYNGELKLKYLDSINMFNTTGFVGIDKIILENTCKIGDIPGSLLDKFVGLEEITLCDSVKTICGYDLKRFVFKDAEGWYINYFRNNGLQKIRVIHKPFM